MQNIISNTVIGAYSIYFNNLHRWAPQRAAHKAVQLFSKPRIRKFRPMEMDVLSRAKEEIIKFDNLNIRTYHWEGGEKTVLLVHGWEGHAGHLGAFVAPLQEAGYSILAFDGPGHGKSEGKYTNLIHFGKLISLLIEKYKAMTLITHSFGSASASYSLYSQKHSIENLVMVTSPDKMEDVINSYGDFMKFRPTLKEDILEYINQVLGKDLRDVQVSAYAPLMDVNKVMLVHSPSDRILSFKNSENIFQNIPHAVLEAPENKGHYRVLWDKEVVEKVVRFIQEKRK